MYATIKHIAHIQVQPYHEGSGDTTGTKDNALP